MTGVITSIRQEVIRTARRQGVDREVAARIADEVCTAIRGRHGGDREYIPAPDVRARNRRIVDGKKSGLSHAEIARREGVNPKTVSRVVAHGFGSEEWVL